MILLGRIISPASRALLGLARCQTRGAASKSPTPVGGNSTQIQNGDKGAVKFTTSGAHVKYKATRNFYGDDRDLPPSHNYMLSSTFILATFYLIFLRDDIEGDGGASLFVPIHETIPELAIPMLQTAIAEHRKFGQDTKKLEKKLLEYQEEAEKKGKTRKKLVDN